MRICVNFSCMGRPPGVRYPIFITLRIDEDTKKVLDGIARAEERSLTQMSRVLLKEAILARGGSKKNVRKPKGKKHGKNH